MVNRQQQKPPHLPEIVGPSLERHLNRIAKWKDSDEPILFLGKTGTGKELFAQYLASLNGKPFYPMNCVGIPENLFENIIMRKTVSQMLPESFCIIHIDFLPSFC